MADLEMNNIAQFAYDLGASHDALSNINGTPIVVVPPNYQVIEKNNLRTRPVRIEQNVTLHTADSLLEYIKQFGDESSMIFCDERTAKFTVIFDYHGSIPNWCSHIANYTSPTSREWDTWSAADGKKMSQEDFALFIERNAKEIQDPNAADMLEIAMTLQTKKDVKFKSGIRLNNGQVDFSYTENIDGTAGHNGQLKIPDTITLGVRVFQGGDGYQLQAKLRYRITEGKLSIWYDLINKDVVKEDATQQLIAYINTGIEKIGAIGAVLSGLPS